MTAAAGSVVKLYVDSRQRLEPGHVVMTSTGRRYLVETVRVATRGRNAGIRQHFTAVVMRDDEPTPAVPVLEIRWYRR